MTDAADLVLLIASVTISYAVRRRIYLGIIDPLKLSALSEGVWVVTVYRLLLEGMATPAEVSVFGACLLLWWVAWELAGRRWGARYRLAIAAFWQRVAGMRDSTASRLTVLYLIGLFALSAVTVASGGGGDNRLVVMKAIKPIESVTTLLVPIVLFRLLIASTWRSRTALVLVLTLMIVSGGKSAILSLLIPVTGASLIGRIRLDARRIAALVAVALLGFSAAVMLNYGVTDPAEILGVLYTRMALDGDVYLLALPNDLLAQTSTTSLTSYLLGPLIKLLFLPIHVDTAIGAQIGSLIRDEETVNGPNPHWPIVLLAYHRTALSAMVLSIFCFAIVLWVKLRLPSRPQSRQWPLWFALPFNAYALLYPQAFFADPSFPLIYLVQAGVLAGLLSLALRPVSARRVHRFPASLLTARTPPSRANAGSV